MTKIKCILVILLAGLCQSGRAQHGDLDRSRLPEPVFSANPGYVDLYWKAWELAWDHVEEDDGLVSSP